MDASLLEISLLVGSLTLVALLSFVEAALVGVSPSRLGLADEESWPGVDRLQAWRRRPGRILLGLHTIRMAGVAGAAVAGYLCALRAGWLVPYLGGLVAVAVAVLEALFAEALPRHWARRAPYHWAVRTAWVGSAAAAMTAPISGFLRIPFRWVARRMHGQDVRLGVFWTPAEIEQMAADAQAQALGEGNEHILRSIIEFSDTVTREIMVPRTAMVAIAVEDDASDAAEVARRAGHSRVPVYEDTIDNIIGLLHVKQLYAALLRGPAEESVDLRRLLRPTFFVPEVMPISELLREFQRRKTHMAIAVDEYGGTAGVVTLEDIIEEIVGEIQDEYDVEEKQFRQLADGKVVADGRVHLWDLEKPLGVEFPEAAHYETLAGFVIAQLGYLPEPGVVVTWEGLRFTVKEADHKRVQRVEVERRT